MMLMIIFARGESFGTALCVVIHRRQFLDMTFTVILNVFAERDGTAGQTSPALAGHPTVNPRLRARATVEICVSCVECQRSREAATGCTEVPTGCALPEVVSRY